MDGQQRMGGGVHSGANLDRLPSSIIDNQAHAWTLHHAALLGFWETEAVLSEVKPLLTAVLRTRGVRGGGRSGFFIEGLRMDPVSRVVIHL